MKLPTKVNNKFHCRAKYITVLQSKDQTTSLLYADVNGDDNDMILNITIIKYT